MSLAAIRKALVPVGVALVLAILSYFGVTRDMTVAEAATLLVTSLLVYLIPNN